MGAWGPRLYQNDVAQDVKDYYKDQLHRGKNGQEITRELIEKNDYILSDEDDAPVFWFALADTQWSLGRLEESVKTRALYYLNKGADIERWEIENPKEAKNRKKVLGELKKKLLSPQPPEKKITQYKLYHCQWKTGDIFAYQFSGEYAMERGFGGKYVYFVKVAEAIWHPGHTVPIVYFFKVLDNTISDIKMLYEKEYIPQFYVPDVYKNNPELKKKYALMLLNTSAKIIPEKNLTYLGNMQKIERINGEDENPYCVAWKQFETYMVDNFTSWLYS